MVEAAPSPAASAPVRTERTDCVLCGCREHEWLGQAPDFEYGTCAEELPFVRCAACGHVYLGERPAPSELSRIYPEDYGNHDATRERALTFRVKSWLDGRSVRKLARRAPDAPRVLDVGCADGRLLDVCKVALPDAHCLEGIEVSERAARGARDKGYTVRIGSVDDITLPEGAYDLVFLQQVIEHVYQPDRVLRMLGRALCPGGVLVLETPCVEGLDFRLFQRRYWGGYHAPRHFNLFNAAGLAVLGAAAGLSPVEQAHTPQPIHWVWSLRHWLTERGAPEAFTRPLHIQNPFAIGAATAIELGAWLVSGRMSNLRVVFTRLR